MTWKLICNVEDVPDNTLRRFIVGGIPVVVANYAGAFRVLPPVCPHMEEPLDESGVIANCVLTCTKHLWSWNLGSMKMLGETERPLQAYDVKELDGSVFAFIEKEIVYDFNADESDDDDFFK
jgi:toluene monooxygenase system ferredoxin subunit